MQFVGGRVSGNQFFQRLVATTRLSSLFADNSVGRACERHGIDPTRLHPSDVVELMPDLERIVRGFLPADQHDDVIADIRALTERPTREQDFTTSG